MNQMTAWATKRRRILAGAAAGVLIMAVIGLCGCGGGNSVVDEGFIITPNSDPAHPVQPTGGPIFTANPGSVTTGLKVSAANITQQLPVGSRTDPAALQQALEAGRSPLPAQSAPILNSAFQLTLVSTDPQFRSLHNSISIQIAFAPRSVPGFTTLAAFDLTSVRIYTFDQGVWKTLPNNHVTLNSADSGSVTATLAIDGNNAISDSGLYAILFSAPSSIPPPPLIRRL